MVGLLATVVGHKPQVPNRAAGRWQDATFLVLGILPRGMRISAFRFAR
jgi:hypothetical protein